MAKKSKRRAWTAADVRTLKPPQKRRHEHQALLDL
jgi:hypothetical protein